MTRRLDGMNSPFTHGSTKQQLVMRELKKMVVNVGFVFLYCSPQQPFPVGTVYSAILVHHTHYYFTMKEFLVELSKLYMLMNPIRGIMPGSQLKNTSVDNYIEDEIDKRLEDSLSAWQNKALKHANKSITPSCRFKFKILLKMRNSTIFGFIALQIMFQNKLVIMWTQRLDNSLHMGRMPSWSQSQMRMTPIKQ